MKQATLSRKLTALEGRVGVRLFDRSTRGAVPTVSGVGFLNQTRRIVADLDTLVTSSRTSASGEEGKLGIGFSTSLAAGQRSFLTAVQQLEPLAAEAGCSMTQFALAWVLREPNVASAIVGASRPA